LNGSVIEKHGTFDKAIKEGDVNILFTFQLVNKQVYINCDGILGWNFFVKSRHKFCIKLEPLNSKPNLCKYKRN